MKPCSDFQGPDVRILHIGKFYPPYAGGMEIFLRDLLKSLKDEGSEVAGLVHQHLSGRTTLRDEVEGVPIFRVSSLGQILYTPISPSFPLVLRKIIRSFHPHILHLHLPNPSAFWCLALSDARSVPWVIQWQSDVVPSAIDRRLQPAYQCYRPLEQRVLRRAEKILVASKPYLQHSIPLKPWIPKCTVVPLGVDPERLPWPGADALQQAERRWRPGCLRVLAVGRLTYYKGFDVLIRAAERTEGVAVQIVGDGNLRVHLQKAIHRKGLENRVLLRGGLRNEMLQALFATCHVLCLPSLERTEAFGVVLLEAMRYGKPVVASDIPGSGPGWVVRMGECGWLVPPGDVDALAMKMKNLAAEPGVCRELGRKGRENFEKKFHIQSVARGVKEIYEDILESSGVAGS
jgi:glycosyltransferase involved in cell wall biosynthesis